MILKRIYRVKIAQCSLNFMWYKNHIGLEIDCELVSNSGTLFESYTSEHYSYKSILPVAGKVQDKCRFIENKSIRLSEPILRDIQVTGWILDEDAEILEIKEKTI